MKRRRDDYDVQHVIIFIVNDYNYVVLLCGKMRRQNLNRRG